MISMGTSFCLNKRIYPSIRLRPQRLIYRVDSKHLELSKRRDAGLHCKGPQAAMEWVFSTFAIGRVISRPSRVRLPASSHGTKDRMSRVHGRTKSEESPLRRALASSTILNPLQANLRALLVSLRAPVISSRLPLRVFFLFRESRAFGYSHLYRFEQCVSISRQFKLEMIKVINVIEILDF